MRREGGAWGKADGLSCPTPASQLLTLQPPLPTPTLLQERIKDGEARRAAAQRVTTAMKVRRAAGIQEATTRCPLDGVVGCRVPQRTPSTHHCPV